MTLIPNYQSLLQIWRRHHQRILSLTIIIMTALTVVWLSYQFWRLLSPNAPLNAVDLKLRYREVHLWFQGKPIYEIEKIKNHAVYPPASYVLLWPLLGWLSETSARWLWAITSIAALGWSIYLIIKHNHTKTLLEGLVLILMPLSMYATGATIGNGQLAVHIIPCLICGILILYKPSTSWWEELLAITLTLFALVKPSISAPFILLFLFLPSKKIRPLFLVGSGYIGLTLFASVFQNANAMELIESWLQQATQGSIYGATYRSVNNIHQWLSIFNLETTVYVIVSLIMLSLAGLWIYQHQRCDPWLLMGIVAFVARFWTYHGWYDDLLILLPAIALWRIAKSKTKSIKICVISAILFASILLTVLAPGGLYLFPSPWKEVYTTIQMMVWGIVFSFLLWQARLESH